MFHLVIISTLIASSFSTNIQPLTCDSVNNIRENDEIGFVFVAKSSRDCTFVFEGPENGRLDLRIRSLSKGTNNLDPRMCEKTLLKMYNPKSSRFLNIEENRICSETKESAVQTESNMAIIKWEINGDAFMAKVRSFEPNAIVFGMAPPLYQSKDFYSSPELRLAEASFQPSLGVPNSNTLTSSYGPPNYSQTQWPYQGKPSPFVYFTTPRPATVTVTETAITGNNNTASMPESTVKPDLNVTSTKKPGSEEEFEPPK